MNTDGVDFHRESTLNWLKQEHDLSHTVGRARDARNILYHSTEGSTGGHWKVTLEWLERRRMKEGEL